MLSMLGDDDPDNGSSPSMRLQLRIEDTAGTWYHLVAVV